MNYVESTPNEELSYPPLVLGMDETKIMHEKLLDGQILLTLKIKIKRIAKMYQVPKYSQIKPQSWPEVQP